MTKQEALKLIDDLNRTIINPVTMLHLVTLRVIIKAISDDEWSNAVTKAEEILSR